MAADTFSSGLGYIRMATGNDNNAWGDNANNFAFQIFEDAISGALTSAVTGGTLDLSTVTPPAGASTARYAMLIFTGALVSNQTVTVPNLTKTWLVTNNTTGAFVMKIKTASGTGALVPQGGTFLFACLGSNIIIRVGAKTGQFGSAGGTSIPSDALACSGALLSRTDFSDLFLKIGTTWGVGDGFTTFGLPNFTDTNRYLRAAGGAVPVGTYQTNQTASHTHTGSVTISANTGTESATHVHAVIGTTGTSNQDLNHAHTYLHNGGGALQAGPFGPGNVVDTAGTTSTSLASGYDLNAHTHSMNFNSQTQSANHFHFFTGTGSFTTAAAGTGTETRPESAAVTMFIYV